MKPTDMPSGSRPGDFVLGSVESRAAARAILDRASNTEPLMRVQVVHIGHNGTDPLPAPTGNEFVEIIHISGSEEKR